MTNKERQFEERLDSLMLLKALLIKDNEFDEVTQKEYHEASERAFDLLEQSMKRQRQSSSHPLPNCLCLFVVTSEV